MRGLAPQEPQPFCFSHLRAWRLGMEKRQTRDLRGRRRLLRRTHRSLLVLSILAIARDPRSHQWASAQVSTSTCGSSTTLQVGDLVEARGLMAAVNCTGGGEVDAIWTGAVTLDAPIFVGEGTFVSITGEGGQAEIRGGSSTRLFELSAGSRLSLTELKIVGGTAATGGGGAIHSSLATVTLDSCVFEQNTASDGDGGAVWVEGGALMITGGSFLSNNAGQLGGAVVAIDAALVIEGGTTFVDNKAVEGGALFCGGTGDEIASTDLSCFVTDAFFFANNASAELPADFAGHSERNWLSLHGGGAASFVYADVLIRDTVFDGNYAQVSGGAVFGGNDTDIAFNGCTMTANNVTGFGAAIAVSSATLGGGTLLSHNLAERNAGAVFGWDPSGVVELNDVECSDNSAEDNGGCLYGAGISRVNNGTLMRRNVAELGACVYAWGGCDMVIAGGDFACESTKNGGFLFASDGALVTITGGLFANNVAARRGAAVYCSGDSFEMGGSAVTIEGGSFINNQALELGGGIVAWGTPTVVTVKGGLFRNNTAKFYGGFIFLEEEASLTCEGATIQENFAGDQGGAIYARDATWINSSCDMIANEAPQGAAAYLTYVVERAEFENLRIADNVASGGSVFFAAQSAVIAREVSFESGVGLQEDSSNRALQLDSGSTLVAEDCIFSGWLGDTVLHATNPNEGSLVLDSCDFSDSSATTVVISPYSDAEIRNAVIGDHTLEKAVTVNGSSLLVDRALHCGDANACGAGACVNSSLGVLCECLENGECLDGGGALSLSLQTPPGTVTYSPDPVSFELVVAASADGTTYAIWNMSFEAEELALEVVPSSGVLPPGDNITVAVTGSPLKEDVGGELTSRFVVTSVGSGTTDSTTGVGLEVSSTFYLCRAFEYAVPLVGSSASVDCEQCVAIDGDEGVDCDKPGATLASLPVRSGYWRSSKDSQVVHSCIHPEACIGGTTVSTSDSYCKDGYEGPYCAVCSNDFGQGVGNTCHECDTQKGRLLIAAGAVFCFFILTFLVLAVVFLVGGLDAVGEMRRSVARTFSVSTRAPEFLRSMHGSSGAESTAAARVGDNFSMAPAFNAGSETRSELQARGDAADSSDGVREGSSRSPGMAVGMGTGLLAPNSRPSTSHPEASAGRAAVASDGTHGGNTGTRAAGFVIGVQGTETAGARAADGGERQGCCGLGEKIKRWMSRLPFDKLKILVVVWQILTVFPSITAVDFPPSYSRFLSWIDFVNLDVGHVFSASCVLPSVNFYQRLLMTTLGPIGLAGVLVVTYHLAKRRAGIGSAGVIARRAAWSRHMAAGLLLTFLVFTSTSTTVFKTFACDSSAVEGKSYLRADFSISCKTDTYTFFKVYAALMLLVYPIGIPLLYAFILWTNRHSLNPSVRAQQVLEMNAVEEEGADSGRETDGRAKSDVVFGGQKMKVMSAEELEELNARVSMRKTNPDLVPSMFLWKDFGPDLYYYEVIECGRRILLTGVLIFIAPHTPAQAAMACIFAFSSLLGFELLRPHLDPTDSWLYRLGCVVIFLSNFLALLIKVDAAGAGRREALGGLLVAVNVGLVIAVIVTTWFATQQSVDEARDDDNAFTMAKTMVTAERLAANSARNSRQMGRHGSSAPPPAPAGVGQLRSMAAAVGPSPSRSAGARGLQAGSGSGGVGGGVQGARGGVPASVATTAEL